MEAIAFLDVWFWWSIKILVIGFLIYQTPQTIKDLKGDNNIMDFDELGKLVILGLLIYCIMYDKSDSYVYALLGGLFAIAKVTIEFKK